MQNDLFKPNIASDIFVFDEGPRKSCQAVIVTYNPNFNQLSELLCSLESQVAGVVIVDNASVEFDWSRIDSLGLDYFKIDLIKLDNNLGLGGGLNIGVNFSKELNFPFVLLLDQDSLPDSEMVNNLHLAYERLNTVKNVAAVGPTFKDPLTGFLSRFKAVTGQRQLGFTEVDFLITSGSYVSIAAFDRVGKFDEGLFIDYVDAEWCFRAKKFGMKVFGIDDAIMTHSLGESRIRIWLFRWRTISLHRSFRYYYIFRNWIHLTRKSYVPLRWKIINFYKLIGLILVIGLLGGNKFSNLKMALKGVASGFLKVKGPLL
jgi:rhamnosyltransferase